MFLNSQLQKLSTKQNVIRLDEKVNASNASATPKQLNCLLRTSPVLLTKSLGKSANQGCNVTAETEQQTAQASELPPLAEAIFPFFLSSFFKVHFTFDAYQHL